MSQNKYRGRRLWASPSLPTDLGAAARLPPAADADEDDVADDEEDSSTARPIYPGLQFCASQHTDRVYLYTQVPQLIRGARVCVRDFHCFCFSLRW